MSIFKQIKNNSKKTPNKIAVVVDGIELTYSELVKEVGALTRFLLKLKVRSGEKVGLVENNSIEFVLIFLAISNIGAIIVPLNTSYTKKMIYYNFEKIKIDHLILWYKYLNLFKKNELKLKNIITTEKRVKGFSFLNDYIKFKNLKKININVNKSKEFLILLTSGSTNKPKPIVLSQKSKILRSVAARKLYKINSRDVVLTASPLDHSLGQRIFLLPLLAGGTSIILKVFTPFNFYRAYEKYKFTFTILIPNQINELIKKKEKFKNFNLKKGLVSASSKLSDKLKKKLIKKKIKIYEMYGTSEIGTATSVCVNDHKKNLKSVGKPYANISIKILSNKNNFLPKIKKGEIVCKTPFIFDRYYNMTRETKESFYKGYFKTGDIGYLNKSNYLYYLGRKKNIIKISGNVVYAEDVEDILLRNKKILEASVIGLSDKNNFEKIALCAVLNSKSFTKENIYHYCQNNLASFQQPTYIFILNSFPKTTLGKIDRQKLKRIIINKL